MQRLCTMVLGLGACQPHADPDSWSGENLDYFASPTLEVCGGTHRLLDEFVEFFAAELGVPIPPGITYNWLDSLSGTDCPEGATGCARGSDAYSTTPFLPHEVAHTVASGNRMNSWSFFAEGIATAYDPFYGTGIGPRYLNTQSPGTPLLDPRPALTMSPDLSMPKDLLFYPTAGSFVAFLLSRHGPGPFVSMVQHLPDERELEVLRGVFRENYPTELDDEAELFMQGAACPEDAFPTLLFDCAMPEVAWQSTETWSYDRTIDCADDDVVGGYKPGQAFSNLHSVTLDVPASATYDLRVTGDSDLQIQLGACFGCPWERRGIWAGIDAGATETYPLELDAGPYFLRIVGSSDAPANVQIELRRQ
jgi:hypothetical protein